MAKTYGLVNMISSLGFAYLWRKSCIDSVPGTARNVCDLMAGGGECLPHIKKKFGPSVKVNLVDWSTNMCQRAEQTISRHKFNDCTVLNCDALHLPAADQAYDVVVSTFGLKTFSDEQLATLAAEIKRVLKKGGKFSLLEFSLPKNKALKPFFKVYVKIWVPLLGWLFLGNPDHYRMLWRYTAAFGDCSRVQKIFESQGLNTNLKSYFWGSATQICGES
jgi:demethylmenaquinone methyltransferase/2-methoxy-6-polyprenyl-1,4-benzoquinol methylase